MDISVTAERFKRSKEYKQITSTMEKQKIEIELTLDELTNLEYIASIAQRETEEYARDVLTMFLHQVTAPIINLPKSQTDGKE